MKKLCITILAALYLTTSTGAIIHMHFCMGELISWKLHNEEDPGNCASCGMKSKGGCCEQKSKFVKLDQDQKFSKLEPVSFTSQPQLEIPKHYYPLQVIIDTRVEKFPNTNSPPGTNKIPLYIRNCIFLL
jgi:hypothetical protein